MTTTDDRDPELFCRCGHHQTEHHPAGRCVARLPDRCSCHGFRLGRLARPTTTQGSPR